MRAAALWSNRLIRWLILTLAILAIAAPAGGQITDRLYRSVCECQRMAEQGCLLGYGPNLAELNKRTANYVACIFRGAPPGDVPIEQPTHFEFAINLKTAKALGLDSPRDPRPCR